MKKRRIGDTACAYFMLAPFLVFFAAYVLYPVMANVYYSFTNYKLAPGYDFVGLKNYTRLFTDKVFLQALGNTAIFAFFSVAVLTGLGLFIAAALYKGSRVYKWMRTVLIFPYATSIVAVSMIWLLMLEPSNGFINKVLEAMGAANPPQWLFDRKVALAVLVLINIWKNIGYVMIIYTAGLAAIPAELYEAATVDGAGEYAKLRHITIPSIGPVTFFVFVTTCIESFKTFELVKIMTGGGPVNATTTVVHQIYVRFGEFQFGYASAMSVVLVAIIFAVTLLNLRFGSREV